MLIILFQQVINTSVKDAKIKHSGKIYHLQSRTVRVNVLVTSRSIHRSKIYW